MKEQKGLEQVAAEVRDAVYRLGVSYKKNFKSSQKDVRKKELYFAKR